MAIVVNFIGVPVMGPSPLGVQYTDLSEGGPTNWGWDFGDGFGSNEQHPYHVYAEDGLYTVTLRAFISTGSTTVLMSPGVREQKIGPQTTGFNEAYAAFLAVPWGSTGFNVNMYRYRKLNPTDWFFQAVKREQIYNFTSFSNRVILFEGKYGESGSFVPKSACKNESGKTFPNPSGFAYTYWFDATAYVGTNFSLHVVDLFDYAILPIGGGIDQWVGWELAQDSYGGAKPTVYSYSDNSTLTKPDYILVGAPCIANGWGVLESSKVPRIPSGYDLVVSTDESVHLFARYMPEVPEKTTLWKVKYGMRYRCQPVFDMLYSGEVEQSEAGETTVHTFDMSIMPASKTLVIVLHGTQCSVASASRGPLMMYDNTVV